MQHRYLAALASTLLVALLAAPQALSAQKVKLKQDRVAVTHLRLPTRHLPAAARTYSRSVSATTDTRATLGGALGTLERGAAIPGYRRVDLGDVHVELLPEPFQTGRLYSQRKETSTKDKEGNVKKTVSYTALVPAYFTVTARVLARGGEVLHEERFGPAAGAPSKAKGTTRLVREPGAYAGEPLLHPSTTYRYDVRLDGTWSSEAELAKSTRKGWSRHVDAVRDEVVTTVANALAARLAEMGYAATKSEFKLPYLKPGHPETDAFGQHHVALTKVLGELQPGADLAGLRAQAAPALAYYRDLYDASAGDDKQVAKLREACLDHLSYGHAYLEQFDALGEVVATLPVKEQRQLEKRLPPLQREVAKRLADLPVDSRYHGTFAETESALPPPAEGATASEVFGLRDREMLAAAREEKIGLTEVEQEFPGRAWSATGRPYTFTGVAAPRETVRYRKADAGAFAKYFMQSDVPPVFDENIRGYVVGHSADDVHDVKFQQLKYDSLTIGNRLFVRLPDLKLNLVDRATMALPTWFEVVYIDPELQVYQHAWTAFEAQQSDLATAGRASYTIVRRGEKPRHTNSGSWAFTPVKSFAKFLACPAVDAYVADAKPAINYYTVREMAQLFGESCAGAAPAERTGDGE